MNSIGWVGGGDVSVGVVSTSSCWQPAHPPSLLLNVKARAERAALHLCGGVRAGACAACCRLERKSLGIARGCASFAGFGCAWFAC